MTDVKKSAKRALAYTKRKGILTDVVDVGEKYILSRATKPEHGDLTRTMRGKVRRRYGVGFPNQKLRDSLKVRKRQRITWLSYGP